MGTFSDECGRSLLVHGPVVPRELRLRSKRLNWAMFGLVLRLRLWCLMEAGARRAACTYPGMPKAQLKKEPAAASLQSDAAVAAAPPDPVAPGTGAASGKRGKSKVPLYALAFVAVAACALYFVWHASSREAGAKSDAENTLALEGFVVNLGGGGPRAYLRVGLTLSLSRELPRKRDDLPMAALRDAALSVLSSAQPEQLLAPEGKQKLKAALLQALQERAPELGIDNVYFTEFLVQM